MEIDFSVQIQYPRFIAWRWMEVRLLTECLCSMAIRWDENYDAIES